MGKKVPEQLVNKVREQAKIKCQEGKLFKQFSEKLRRKKNKLEKLKHTRRTPLLHDLENFITVPTEERNRMVIIADLKRLTNKFKYMNGGQLSNTFKKTFAQK